MKPLTLKEWLENLRGAMQAQWDFCNGCKYHDHPCYILDEDDSEWMFDETWCINSGICKNGDKFEDIPTLKEDNEKSKTQLFRESKHNNPFNYFILMDRKEQKTWNIEMIVDILVLIACGIVSFFTISNIIFKIIAMALCFISATLFIILIVVENIQMKKIKEDSQTTQKDNGDQD